MSKLRFGVVGVGGIGYGHARRVKDLDRAELAAVCDIDRKVADRVAQEYNCKAFYDYKEMIRPDNIDAVFIATPHYAHTPIAIWACEHDVHVLTEKPIAVHVADAEKMLAAHERSAHLKFAVRYQRRLLPVWRKLKQVLSSGETGKVYRVAFSATHWYRKQSYYDSGNWRATWAGEGGGVLINQCPHQLDLLQWMFGMPSRIYACCGFGKYHDIEVEDDVTAVMEYSDGKVVTFFASTGEYPGSDRVEISCDRGRIVVEKDKIFFEKTTMSVSEATRGVSGPMPLEVWPTRVPVDGSDPSHGGIVENFVDAVLDDVPLVCPAEEAVNSLILINTMIYSGYYRKEVLLPLDPQEYKNLLDHLIGRHQQRALTSSR